MTPRRPGPDGVPDPDRPFDRSDRLSRGGRDKDRDADPERASILRVPPGGGKPATFARGVRNGTGLAVDPDGAVWTAVNHRDNIEYPHDRDYDGEGVRVATGPTEGNQPVTPDGPADQAGIKAGDVITKFNNRPVTEPDELIVAIRAQQPGDTVKLTVRSGSSERVVDVVLRASEE